MEQILHATRLELWQMSYAHWLNSELFSLRWWGLVIFLVLIYAVWWRLLDKARILEIILFGSLVSVMAAFTDIVGLSSGAWQYNVRLFPISPAPFPLDFSVIPIGLMLAYQYSDNWRSYTLAALAASGLYALDTAVMEAVGILASYYWNPAWAFVESMTYAAIVRAVIIAMKNLAASSRPASPVAPVALVPRPALKPGPENDENAG